MFLGSTIYRERVRNGLTQAQLANGICTQNTVSKIEKHNVPPTVTILLRICARLKLTLNDVFSEFNGNATSEEKTIVDTIESNLLRGQLQDLDNQFSIIMTADFNTERKIQYYFVKGALEYYSDNLDASLFTLDQTLQSTKNDTYDIYTLLAYIFKALAYEKQEHNDRSDYYLQLVKDSISENFQIENATVEEKLFILTKLAENGLKNGEYNQVANYCKRALNETHKNSQIPFVANLYLLLSEAYKYDNNDKNLSSKYKEAASFFASLTDDDQILSRLKDI